MALSKTTTTHHGIEVVDAYFRAVNFIFDSKTKMTFNVECFADPEMRPLTQDQYSCTYNLSGGNPHTQAYNYLKTLPEFEGAVDC